MVVTGDEKFSGFTFLVEDMLTVNVTSVSGRNLKWTLNNLASDMQ